ncbi:hypothetical protein D3C86_2221170 [compost metagenome]
MGTPASSLAKGSVMVSNRPPSPKGGVRPPWLNQVWPRKVVIPAASMLMATPAMS